MAIHFVITIILLFLCLFLGRVKKEKSFAHHLKSSTLSPKYSKWGLWLFILSFFFFKNLFLSLEVYFLYLVLLNTCDICILFRKLDEMEGHVLSFFQLLRGYLSSGLSWPSALERLQKNSTGPYYRYLSLMFHGFNKGSSLSQLFSSKTKSGWFRYAVIFQILEVGFERGYSLTKFMDRILPWVSRDQQLRKKEDHYLNLSLLQWVISCAIPLLVLFFTFLCQRDVFHFFISQESSKAFLLIHIGVQIIVLNLLIKITKISDFNSFKRLKDSAFLFQNLLLWIEAGFELNFAWEQLTQKKLDHNLIETAEKGTVSLLTVLKELQANGSSLSPCLEAIVEYNNNLELNRVEAYLQKLPQYQALILIGLGLPTNFGWIILPLITTLTN